MDTHDPMIRAYLMGGHSVCYLHKEEGTFYKLEDCLPGCMTDQISLDMARGTALTLIANGTIQGIRVKESGTIQIF